MSDDTTAPQGITLDQKNIDILVANIIPTTKYFESRFDHLQYQLDLLKAGQEKMATDMDGRFVDMKSDMDARFEQVDKRFEQIDKRFQQLDEKLDKILDRIDRRVHEGLRENRSFSVRMFTFAMLSGLVFASRLLSPSGASDGSRGIYPPDWRPYFPTSRTWRDDILPQ